MGLISRWVARRQLRRSSRQSLETLRDWSWPLYDPRYPTPPQDLRYGYPTPPQDLRYGYPPPAPPTHALHDYRYGQSTISSPTPQSPAPAVSPAAAEQSVERLAASADALIDELIDVTTQEASPPNNATPADLTASKSPTSEQFSPTPPAAPAPPEAAPSVPLVSAIQDTKSPPPIAPSPPAAQSSTPISPPPARPTIPAEPSPPVPSPDPLAEHSEFPPCPTWPYTRKARLRRRRRQRHIR
jgi:hypothetical protein